MTALATRFSITGDYRCFAGEAPIIELAFEAGDGSLADLTGRQFVWTVYRARDREELFAAIGTVIVAGTDRCVRFAIDGDTTEQLFEAGPTGYRHEVAELLTASRDVWVEGVFSIARSAATVNPGIVAAATGPIERAVFDFETRRVIISPRGGAGLSPWEASGQTLAQYNAEVRAPALEAAANALAATDTATAAAALAASSSAAIGAMAAAISDAIAPGAIADASLPTSTILLGDLL